MYCDYNIQTTTEKLSYAQRVLIDTLVSLMASYSFEEITITQLTQEAEVARKTFYLNFSNKENVLRLALRHYNLIYRTYFPCGCDLEFEELITAFFKFAEEHHVFFQRLIKNRLSELIIDEIELFVNEMVIVRERQMTVSREKLKKLPKNYPISYHVGGLCRILEAWYAQGMVEPPKQMGKTYTELIYITQTRYRF